MFVSCFTHVLFPFLFWSTCTISILVNGYCPSKSFSYFFVISQIVNKATVVAKRVSISTPVWDLVFTVTSTSRVQSSTKLMSIPIMVRGIGWHSGIIKLVLFAASTPAILAAYKGSPFSILPSLMRLRVRAIGCGLR